VRPPGVGLRERVAGTRVRSAAGIAGRIGTLARDHVAKGARPVPSRTAGRSETPVAELVGSLSIEQLREVVSAAADRHDDVERAVRLARIVR
jgi:hypothetical protein